MAKIKFGMMMTDARGKLGGQVFSKNRSGAYVRTKVTPVNPQTTSQQANRSLLGNLSSNWSALSDAQRSGWNGAAESWQKTNVFGDLVKPTGKNLFTGLNKKAISLFPGNDTMLNPPTKVEFQAFSIASASFSVNSGIFTVTLDGDIPVGTPVQVRATPIVSNGTTYVKNLYRTLGQALLTGTGGIIDLIAAYSAVFGGISVGQVIYIEVALVAENGQISVPTSIRVVGIN